MKISQEYLLLFNAITDAESALERLRQELMTAQRQAEELFVETREPESRGVLHFPQDNRRKMW